MNPTLVGSIQSNQVQSNQIESNRKRSRFSRFQCVDFRLFVVALRNATAEMIAEGKIAQAIPTISTASNQIELNSFRLMIDPIEVLVYWTAVRSQIWSAVRESPPEFLSGERERFLLLLMIVLIIATALETRPKRGSRRRRTRFHFSPPWRHITVPPSLAGIWSMFLNRLLTWFIIFVCLLFKAHWQCSSFELRAN